MINNEVSGGSVVARYRQIVFWTPASGQCPRMLIDQTPSINEKSSHVKVFQNNSKYSPSVPKCLKLNSKICQKIRQDIVYDFLEAILLQFIF